MIEPISNYYRDKGFNKLYTVINPEGRKTAILYKEDKSSLTMSYAKYLYTSLYEEDVDSSIYHIDHINGDKTDDRIENLQKITGSYNRTKDHSRKEFVVLRCPVCGNEFLFEKRNLSSHPTPCCSRRCGGIKSHWD